MSTMELQYRQIQSDTFTAEGGLATESAWEACACLTWKSEVPGQSKVFEDFQDALVNFSNAIHVYLPKSAKDDAAATGEASAPGPDSDSGSVPMDL